jgi:hypothetical protein
MASFKPTWSASGENSTQVQQFGLQFYSLPAGASGNLYVDDVVISGPPPASCQVLLNSFETLADNGTITCSSGTAALSTSNVTKGTYSLDLDITTGGGWNAGIFNLAGFTPNTMGTTYKYLMVDAYVDSSMVAGASYTQLMLYADTNDGGGHYYIPISSTQPNLVTGPQTLVWTLDFPGAITSTMALSDIFFIYNNTATNAVGNIYLDNLRLATCGS